MRQWLILTQMQKALLHNIRIAILMLQVFFKGLGHIKHTVLIVCEKKIRDNKNSVVLLAALLFCYLYLHSCSILNQCADGFDEFCYF